MKRGFGGRQSEDQPAVAGVDGGEIEDVAEEGAVGVRVGGVEDDVGAGDHLGAPFWRIIVSPGGGVCKELENSTAHGIESCGIPPFAKAAKDGPHPASYSFFR